MNRNDLLKKMSPVTSRCLKEKGYISFVDVLIGMDKLSVQDYENWRRRKVPYLEKVIKINLSQINFLLRSLHKDSLNGRLRPSTTVYKSWGKGEKTTLRFSKFGDPNLERAYSTHYVRDKQKKTVQPEAETAIAHEHLP